VVKGGARSGMFSTGRNQPLNVKMTQQPVIEKRLRLMLDSRMTRALERRFWSKFVQRYIIRLLD
jgi:hypothetical protein